ncbi:hypothetical protein VTL71DRAFT_6616 [Oculimacula yallundae]|uniref:Uncharacterized protein n=1 Tax=Oculimacula yallundae TaxID=86028 RepID=A0ABR4BXF6_9HELO
MQNNCFHVFTNRAMSDEGYDYVRILLPFALATALYRPLGRSWSFEFFFARLLDTLKPAAWIVCSRIFAWIHLKHFFACGRRGVCIYLYKGAAYFNWNFFANFCPYHMEFQWRSIDPGSTDSLNTLIIGTVSLLGADHGFQTGWITLRTSG